MWFKKHVLPHAWYMGFLGLLLGGIIVANFSSGTFITGVDNFHIEIDLGLAWQRAINGVWQDNQGLGLITGLAQATEIPRILWYCLVGLVVPMMYLRQAYLFWCLGLGVLGTYFLSFWLFKNKWSALVAAVFYLTNLATLQTFFMPTEMFATQYGFLPWLILMFFGWLHTGKKKWLAGWGGVLFLALPQAMTPTIWVVEMGFFGLASLVYVGYRKQNWRRLVWLWGLVLAVNSFWLLPFGYFTFTQSNNLMQAKINQIFSTENSLANYSRANVWDVLSLKGMWFDYPDFNGQTMMPLMGIWDQHLRYFGVLVFGLGLLGFAGTLAMWKRGKWQHEVLTGGSILFVLLLLLSRWLHAIPILAEALRTPFTKISVLVGLLFALGLSSLAKKKYVAVGLVLIIGLGSWPLWTGNLINPRLKVIIPDNYFQLFDYLKTQPEYLRVVHLPAYAEWSWDYRDWGYRGSGFLWYGIKQPMLDRAFDVWSPYNETFYNELSTAFYYCSEDQVDTCAKNVKQVFDKYQVSLALLDESVILPGQDSRVMRYELWQQVLAKLDPEPDFKSGSLSVFTVGNNTTGISAPERYRQIEAETTYGRFDPYFSSEVAYVDGNDASYPFAGISKENVTDVVEYSEEGLVKITGSEVNTGKLTFPEFVEGEVWRGRIRATLSGEELKIELLPFGQLIIGEQHLPLWLDQRLEVIQLPEVLESVVVQVGDKTKQILRDKPDEIWDIPMVVGQGLSLKVFEGEGEQIVISTPSARLGQLPKDRLITVSGNGQVCIGYEQKNYKCLNKDHSLVTPQQGVYWLDMLEKVEELPKVASHQLIAGYEFPKEMWQMVKREYELEIRDKKYEIRWEQAGSVIDIRDKKYEIGNKNCDVLKRGEAKKSVIDGEVVYETTDYGAYCDSWWMGPITEEGVLRLTGENEGGRGLKLSVFSTQENRTNLEQLLPSGGRFDQSYGFLTGLEQGSTVNLETKSFGRIKGKNRLDAVKFYPVPLTWLQKIKIGEDQAIDNQLEISEINKWGTGIYQVKIQSPNDKFQTKRLLVLNQGFDNGWVGLKPFDIAQGFQHVKVNGWSNGWMIENSNDKEQISNVLIFYWPQLLEWAGLMMLPLSLFWLRRKSEK